MFPTKYSGSSGSSWFKNYVAPTKAERPSTSFFKPIKPNLKASGDLFGVAERGIPITPKSTNTQTGTTPISSLGASGTPFFIGTPPGIAPQVPNTEDMITKLIRSEYLKKMITDWLRTYFSKSLTQNKTQISPFAPLG